MRSALAARRARLGTSKSRQSVAIEGTATPQSPPSSTPEDLLPDQTPKRKLNEASHGRRVKKPRTQAHQRLRYFAAEGSSNMVDDVVSHGMAEERPLTDSDSESTPLQEIKSIFPQLEPPKEPYVPLNDSSDADMGTDLEPEIPTFQAPQIERQQLLLSTFQPLLDKNTFYPSPEELRDMGLPFGTRTSACLLALNPTDTLTLLGTYTITVLRGLVHICGVQLKASKIPYSVFAPRCSAIPTLKCVSREEDMKEVVLRLPEHVHASVHPTDTLVLIGELRTGVEGLGQVCQIFDSTFSGSVKQPSDRGESLKLAGVHMLSLQTQDIQPFFLPPSWEKALSSIVPDDQDRVVDFRSIVYLVKGPKNSGKSTFARTLLNRLSTRYQKVAFLECDVGQSEFTPGGMVSLNVVEKSLFGPPFTHPTLPNAAHYVGSTSPKSSPSHYISAIRALVHTYKLHFQTRIDCDSVTADDRISDTIPLVVNTMGWTKGLGIELTRQIEEIVNATDIFEFSNSNGQTSRLSLSRPSSTKTHHLEPISPSVLSSKYTAADYRTLSILSYFFAVFPSCPENEPAQVSATSWDTSLPLCAHPPYEVDWSIALDKVILVGAGAEDVVHEEIEGVLNTAVVALVACSPSTVLFDEEGCSLPRDAIPYSQGHSPPAPSSSTCHGLALIRGVSPKSTHFHVLTPLPPRLLAQCRVFVKGELELPIWGFLDHTSVNGEVAGVEEGKVPYLQWGKAQGVGSERRKVRRNLMRKSQI